MRLWHYKLIPILDRQRKLGQHREVCALRGNGWKKKHATVDYIFNYSLNKLYSYHKLLIDCMPDINIDQKWLDPKYRGKNCEPLIEVCEDNKPYPEHNDDYLNECVKLLIERNPDYYIPIL